MYEDFFSDAEPTSLRPFFESFREALARRKAAPSHGRQREWDENLGAITHLRATSVELASDTVRIGKGAALADAEHFAVHRALEALIPWRKGPFRIFGTDIDTEWRSDWKWRRIVDHCASLDGRTVLDVGCGSGYHCWRMRGEGAAFVLGVEPLNQYVEQFRICRTLIGSAPVHVLPIGVEDLPAKMGVFDSVFSMGLLYHRKAPLAHIETLREVLRPGGEMILETLVVDGPLHHVLVPKGRYAQMRNVWFLPSVPTLTHWVERMGFESIRVVDVNETSFEEQRSTQWMRFHSLQQFLDPADSSQTVEGYPRPVRAMLVATKPL